METKKVMLIKVDGVNMLVCNNEIGNKDITIYATDKDDDKLDINPAFTMCNKIGSEHYINLINGKPIPGSNNYIATIAVLKTHIEILGDELPDLNKSWDNIITEALKDRPHINNYFTCLVNHLKNNYNPPTEK